LGLAPDRVGFLQHLEKAVPAEHVALAVPVVSNWSEDFSNTCLEKVLDFPPGFTPPIYNVWKKQAQTSDPIATPISDKIRVLSRSKSPAYLLGDVVSMGWAGGASTPRPVTDPPTE
jgi:hypothetical protein